MANPFEDIQNQLGQMSQQLAELFKQQSSVARLKPECPVNVDRVAAMLGISPKSVYDIKEIPRYKRNGRLYFFESDVLDYIRKGQVDEPPNQVITRRPRRNRRQVPL